MYKSEIEKKVIRLEAMLEELEIKLDNMDVDDDDFEVMSERHRDLIACVKAMKQVARDFDFLAMAEDFLKEV